jgi:hypothetical protein
MNRTDGRLDAAVLCYRNNPSSRNYDLLMIAMREHHDAFLREQTIDYQERTH